MISRRLYGSLIALAIVIGSQPLGVFAQDSGHWLSRIRLLPGENERSHRTVTEVFREIVSRANESTVRVLSAGDQIALGAIVDSNGYVVTKASELQGELQCLLADGRRLDASLVSAHPEYDLALLRVQGQRLPAVQWATSPSPTAGSWLATAGLSEYPTAIGIVSANARPLPRPQTILGVGLEQFEERPRVNRVVSHSAADKAGLQVGDVIVALNGENMDRPSTVSAAVRKLLPGEQVSLGIRRGTQSLTISATLGEASRLGNEEQAELMDSLGGPLSQRRAGFPYVLQHDTVLRPKDCGGPVVDLDGRVVGINIARVSRVASYAIPADQLKPVLAEMMAGKYPARTETVALETAAGGE